jgi:hypothetical protein
MTFSIEGHDLGYCKAKQAVFKLIDRKRVHDV